MDTGTYIKSGFLGETPLDRPIMYGLFIRHSSMGFSLWFTIYAQAVLLAMTLYFFIKEIIKENKKFRFYYLLVIIFLTSFSSIGWYASQIMPDIFTSILILSLIILVSNQKLSTIKIILLSSIFVFSCSMHYSHLLIAIVACIILFFLFLIAKIRKRNAILSFERLSLISFLSVVAVFLILILNYTHKGGFRLSRGGQTFLMAHFIETGTIQEYLQENCDKPSLEDCRMCIYKDSLQKGSIDFLWSYNSPLYKLGGWERTETEFNYLIQQMMSNPQFFIKNVFCSFRLGLSQLFLNNIGEGLSSYKTDSPVSIEIHEKFKWEEYTYNSSKQQKWNSLLPFFEKISDINALILILSVVVILYYFSFAGTKNDLYYRVGIIIILLILINSFITAGLNIAYSRLESRAIWILMLYAMLLILNKKDAIILYTKKQFYF